MVDDDDVARGSRLFQAMVNPMPIAIRAVLGAMGKQQKSTVGESQLANNEPAVDAPVDTAPKTYLPAEIRGVLDCSDTALRKYANAAGVANRPRKKGERYSHADYCLLLAYIIENATAGDIVANAKRLLAEAKPKFSRIPEA